jgi:hypothetical protein
MVVALVAGVVIGRKPAPEGASAEAGGAARLAASGRAGGAELAGRAGRDGGAKARARAAEDQKADAVPDAAALESILESASRLERTQRLLSFLDRLPAEQFAAVYQQFRDSPLADLRGSERSLVLQAWAERDPLGALGFLQTGGAEDWERETAVSAWAAKDPQSAFAWASSATDEGTINNWQLGALRGIAATSPELARDYLVQMEGNDTRNRALESMQPYLTRYGFDYAANWIEGLNEPGLRGRATRMMADELAELDPGRAGQWNASIADTEVRRDVSETVSDRWARVDLEGAKRWAESLPEDTRTEAAEGIARHYARQDPAAAAAWLDGLGNNPDLDGARRVLIEESFRRAPEVSLGFVGTLADNRSREGLYYRLVGGWSQRDANAARAWVAANASALPENLVRRYTR